MKPSAVDTALLPAAAQPAVAVVVVAVLSVAAAWFAAAGGLSGTLVHDEKAAPVDRRFTVDVNAAGEGELAQLPGLGPAMARRIVDHRGSRGPFTSVDGLLDVPGIGPAKLAAMRPHLRAIAPSDRGPPAAGAGGGDSVSALGTPP